MNKLYTGIEYHTCPSSVKSSKTSFKTCPFERCCSKFAVCLPLIWFALMAFLFCNNFSINFYKNSSIFGSINYHKLNKLYVLPDYHCSQITQWLVLQSHYWWQSLFGLPHQIHQSSSGQLCKPSQLTQQFLIIRYESQIICCV